MDNGSRNIKAECSNCIHWNKDNGPLVDNAGGILQWGCSVLVNTSKVRFDTMGEGVDGVETSPDFGCILFEPKKTHIS